MVRSAVLHAHSVEEEPSTGTPNSVAGVGGVPDAAAIAVVGITIKASSKDTETFVEEEPRVADPLTSAVVVEGLTVVALSGRDASLSGSVDPEATDALGAGVDGS